MALTDDPDLLRQLKENLLETRDLLASVRRESATLREMTGSVKETLREQPRPHVRLVGGEGWGQFLAEHAELSEESTEADPKLTAETVLAALRAAIEDPLRYWKGAAWTSCIQAKIYERADSATLHRQRVGRVTDRLRRMADEGRVIRLRHNFGLTHLWTLPGYELSEDVQKYYTPWPVRPTAATSGAS